MRIRIVKALTGVIESHALSQFLNGHVYDVDAFLGAQLVALCAAVEVRSTDRTESRDDETDMDRLDGGVHVVPPDRSDDRPERRRRKRR